MLLSEYLNRKLPDYYNSMFLDGFSPAEIKEAHHKTMMKQYAERNKTDEIIISSEINLK